MENFDYNFYAVNKNNELVYGFDAREDCFSYCKEFGFKCKSKSTIKKMNLNPENIDYWCYDEEAPVPKY